MHSRIRWNDKLAARVSNILQSMQNKYKMVVRKPVHAMNLSWIGRKLMSLMEMVMLLIHRD